MSPVKILMFVLALTATTAVGAAVYTVFKWHGDSVQLEEAKRELESAEEALQKERDAFSKAAELRVKQIKDVSNVRKEVDDAYRAGRVPERVRKFYID